MQQHVYISAPLLWYGIWESCREHYLWRGSFFWPSAIKPASRHICTTPIPRSTKFYIAKVHNIRYRNCEKLCKGPPALLLAAKEPIWKSDPKTIRSRPESEILRRSQDRRHRKCKPRGFCADFREESLVNPTDIFLSGFLRDLKNPEGSSVHSESSHPVWRRGGVCFILEPIIRLFLRISSCVTYAYNQRPSKIQVTLLDIRC